MAHVHFLLANSRLCVNYWLCRLNKLINYTEICQNFATVELVIINFQYKWD